MTVDVPLTKQAAPRDGRARNEHIKEASNFLRGTLAEGLLENATGAISDDDGQLVKFHGMYLQDDRDLRAERTRKKLEKAFSFMLRLRIPGGVVTPAQWLTLDGIARSYANGTLRATTRQTFQFHGVIKSNLKRTMREIDAALLDTIAACGDVNRNVLSASNPEHTRIHQAAYDLAREISEELLPQSGAWREIWLDGEKVAGGEDEPLYGRTYLPRKFKTVIAVPPDNDVDVFAHDLGFIAILDDAGDLAGWNVTVGGGMGMTHGEPDTFPRIADVMFFCEPAHAVDVAKAVMTVQRDWGDRTNRKTARLKYTIVRHGLPAFRTEVERRAGRAFEDPRPFHFTRNGDRYGWTAGEDGRQHLTLFIENGRIRDVPGGAQMLTGLRRIAEIHEGQFRLTANQNVMVANVTAAGRAAIDALVAEHGLTSQAGALRRNSMACVALPTCGQALAEAERFLPGLIGALEGSLARHGLAQDEITIRMTGCPNGCARPYLAEIGLVGRGPDRYQIYLGGAFDGSRLGRLFADDVAGGEILDRLEPVFADYVLARRGGESFGDFTARSAFL